MNKAELLRQTKIYKIDKVLRGKVCELNKDEINALKFLSRKLSCKIADLEQKPILIRINKQEYVNVMACLPDKTQTGFDLYVKKKAGRLNVWYQTRTRARSESTFKALIPLNANFTACLGLSLGDGLNNPSTRNTHYTFANINFQLTYLIFKWLAKDFGLDPRKFQLSAYVPIKHKTISGICNFERKVGHHVRVYKLIRHRYASLVLQTSNRIFQCLYSKLFCKLKQTILHNSILRRAFLKGLFAAEGHVKHSVFGTIESMSFAYNPALESRLVAFIKTCLQMEGIKAKDNKKGLLYFCGYASMIKFYSIGGLSLHKAKEVKFLGLLRNADPILHLRKKYLNPLRHYQQNRLAKILNCSQPSISNSLRGNYLPLKCLFKLRSILSVSYSSLIKNTEFITIRNSFVAEPESINAFLQLS